MVPAFAVRGHSRVADRLPTVRATDLAPWMVIAPSAAIALLCLSFNLVGEEVRDLLDPRQEARIA